MLRQYAKKRIDQRLQRQYEEEEARLMLVERKAREFAEQTVTIRALKAWRKATILFKSERELEEEHQKRKEQIDSFFNNYK